MAHSRRRETDDADARLLSELLEDGRLSYTELARRTSTSRSEARRRVERMITDGTIARFTVERGEQGASAVVLVSVDSGRDTTSISEEMARMEEIRIVYEITGQYDILAIIEAESIAAINDCIDRLRRMQYVADTNTAIILRRVR